MEIDSYAEKLLRTQAPPFHVWINNDDEPTKYVIFPKTLVVKR